jgi:hypothetical protein
MNYLVPFIWRTNYCKEARRSNKILQISHERARQYLSRAATSAGHQSKQQFRAQQ